MTSKRWMILSVLAVLAVALAGQAGACPVCYGDSDAPVIKGAQISVLFMALVTYFLIGGGVVAGVLLHRRARKMQTSGDSA